MTWWDCAEFRSELEQGWAAGPNSALEGLLLEAEEDAGSVALCCHLSCPVPVAGSRLVLCPGITQVVKIGAGTRAPAGSG